MEDSGVDDIKESQPSSPVNEEGSQNDIKMDDKEEDKITVPILPPSKVDREGNCYCGKERNLNIVELLCASCSRWYHESCIGYQLGKLVPFMMNYVFICKNCSNTGLESFKKNPPSFPQIVMTAMANLMQASSKSGENKFRFSKDKDIIPFIEQHWEGLTTFARRMKQSMHASVVRALTKETNISFLYNENSEEGPVYSLAQQDLTLIKPNYDAMIKQGTAGSGLRRSAKRKLPDPTTVGSKKTRGGDVALPKLPAHGYPMEHPFNKDGYRYYLAEPDPHAPFRQEFDESSDWAGKPIPGWLYRTLVPGTVLLALHDRAPQLKISEDRLSVTGEKGYCMVRSTHSVSRGSWFFEVTVHDMKDGSASRLGWAQEYANLQAPLGYDKFGYAWRSRKGTRFHDSRGKHYSNGYGERDVLGFLLQLPDDPSNSYIPNTYKDKPLVKFKSHLYYEEKDRVAESLKRLQVLPGSKIYFFKNGECQGVAFTDIYAGSYFPAISLHKSATVTINYGPDFKHPPSKDQFSYNGMCLKAEEAICEQTMADLLYLTENDGKLRLDTYTV